MPPLGLGYLAAALRPAHRVRLRDGLRSPEEASPIERGLDAVCVTVTGRDVAATRQVALEAKRANPGAMVILGGPQVSALRGGVLREVTEADFAFLGEAEQTLPAFLGGLEQRSAASEWLAVVPGLVWREGARVRVNAAPAPPDVETLTVAWDLIRPDQYPGRLTGADEEYWPVAPIITTRGCPDACSFCSGGGVSGPSVRRRSVGSVTAEVGLLVREFGVRGVEFMDDNFTGDRLYVLAFCEAVAREFPALRWACPNGVRVDALDASAARAMGEAGCVSVSVGIDATLTRTRKGRTTREALDLLGAGIRRLQAAGIAVDAYALHGVPGEAPEDAAQKVAWMRDYPFRAATFARYEAYASVGGACSAA